MADTLKPGESLRANGSITSANGRYTFIYQGDGNLVLYSPFMPLWDSKTWGTPAGECRMQYDGNLVIYGPDGKYIWDSGTDQRPGSKLILQDDGNVVLYGPEDNAVWATNTAHAQGNDMQPGEMLDPDQSIRSANGLYTLIYQRDGNLVLYKSGNLWLWESKTWGTPAGVCIMQSDGNLVIYNPYWQPIWNSGTWEDHGSRLIVQDDGNVAIYNPSNQFVWSTHAMKPPLIEQWRFEDEHVFKNRVWTEECQGLTTDGQVLFVVSNNKLSVPFQDNFRGVHKFTLNFEPLASKRFQVEGIQRDHHIGAPGYHQGKIYVPVEIDKDKPKVWILDTNLDTIDTKLLGGDRGPWPQGGSMPWCAVNPWNGYLYSSKYDNVNQVYAYDPNDNFILRKVLQLGRVIDKVQGGVISNNGHLYLTSHATKDISAFSIINGGFLGRYPVSYDEGIAQQEMEGITIAPIVRRGGLTAYVHVVILENDRVYVDRDNVFIKHFVVPDPAVL
jgi:hypothetical protein